MAKDPAVLFYTSDFLTGTSFFTDEQRGQYITLLCQQHQLGTIPEEHMLNICKSYDSPIFLKFEKDSKGDYYNKRMRAESERRKQYCESRRSIRFGKKKNKTYVTTYEKHMSPHMETETITDTDNITDTKQNRIESFNNLWSKYPKRIGKNKAFKYYEKSVKTENDKEDIEKALNNYIDHIGKDKTESQYIQHGSTWFNNWSDWTEWTESTTKKIVGLNDPSKISQYDVEED